MDEKANNKDERRKSFKSVEQFYPRRSSIFRSRRSDSKENMS